MRNSRSSFLGKLCEDHGYTYHWISGQKPHLTKNDKRIDCNISNDVPFVLLGLSTSFCTTPTHLLHHHHLHHTQGSSVPFLSDEILPGYEDIVSSGTDQFTTWVKTDPDATLVQDMVDVRKAVAEFREASERRPDTSSQAYRFNKNFSNRSLVQKRLSIYNWNPGPRRGKEDALRNKSQANGMSSRYKKHLSMSIMTFLHIGST